MNVRPVRKHHTSGTWDNLSPDCSIDPAVPHEAGRQSAAPGGLAFLPARSTGGFEDKADFFESILLKERGAAALAALSDDVALVVSKDRQVVDMNDAAAAFVVEANLLAIKTGLLSLSDPEAERWLGQALSAVVHGSDGDPLTRILRQADDVVQLAVFKIPQGKYEADSVDIPPLFLLLVRILTDRPENRPLKDLEESFGLTAAEIRLCEQLLNHRSLQQAADLFQLTLGTVRQRLKVIFQKTETHRQSELISLLKRFL